MRWAHSLKPEQPHPHTPRRGLREAALDHHTTSTALLHIHHEEKALEDMMEAGDLPKLTMRSCGETWRRKGRGTNATTVAVQETKREDRIEATSMLESHLPMKMLKFPKLDTISLLPRNCPAISSRNLSWTRHRQQRSWQTGQTEPSDIFRALVVAEVSLLKSIFTLALTLLDPVPSRMAVSTQRRLNLLLHLRQHHHRHMPLPLLRKVRAR
jgi:hypothetical protein